jgi:hypothetical protein
MYVYMDMHDSVAVVQNSDSGKDATVAIPSGTYS